MGFINAAIDQIKKSESSLKLKSDKDNKFMQDQLLELAALNQKNLEKIDNKSKRNLG